MLTMGSSSIPLYPRASSQDSSTHETTETPRVLVVEDDVHLAQCLASCLEAHGYEAQIVCDGLEALRQFESTQPDVVTLDLNIPTVSGFRLLKLMKASSPGTPILVVTACAFQEVEVVAGAGADDFLMKPFDVNELAQKLSWLASCSKQTVAVKEPE
jgi:DNA-binding response OmpR family regulator